MNDIGDGDYEDLMSGVDMLIENESIDSDKMAVRGWSYGGILGGQLSLKQTGLRQLHLGAGRLRLDLGIRDGLQSRCTAVVYWG